MFALRAAYWRNLVVPANPKFRTFANAGGESVFEPLNSKVAVHATGQGFRSATSDHFNFKTKISGGGDAA